jgi:hypothetical protein
MRNLFAIIPSATALIGWFAHWEPVFVSLAAIVGTSWSIILICEWLMHKVIKRFYRKQNNNNSEI